MAHWIGEIELRKARMTDSETLNALTEDAYLPYVESLGVTPGPLSKDYSELIPVHQVWVAEDGGQIIGLLELIATHDHVVIENLAIAPAYQNRKVGRLLMDHAEAEARRLSVGELRTYTHQKMSRNIAIYHHLGYEQTGRRESVFFRKVLAQRSGAPARDS
jgi:ribosomal protein S18 acetylase RimI-like enzyme